MVKVHEVVKESIDRIVSTPVVQEVIKEIQVEVEKIVQVVNTKTEIRDVQTVRDNTVVVEKFKEYTNVVNHVDT